MRKAMSFFLCLFLFTGLVSAACAQTVSCPEARLILTVPDGWRTVPLSDLDDPELCLHLDGGSVSLYIYAADTGGFLPGFQVFTGDETESGDVTLSGRRMNYVAGSGAGGNYRIYTWQDRRDQIQLYFLIVSSPDASRNAIDRIMDSLVFD